MKKLLTIWLLFTGCVNKDNNKIDAGHIESLALDFMKNKVIPSMKEPKPFEITGAKTVIKTVADNINDYRYVYKHLSFDKTDSLANKRMLDSIIAVSKNPDSVISVTVNVAYKTKYKLGDIVTDSIKLKYNRENDMISFWPF